MGFISSYATKSGIHKDRQLLEIGESPRSVHQAVDIGRTRWRDVFGTNKEDSNKQERRENRPVPGGSFARSSLSTSAAVSRLVQSLRSDSPGGWS